MIDILIPVLSRPANASKVAESAKVTVNPYRLWFICSPADHAQIEACRETDAEILITDWQPRGGDYARKINWGYAQTDWVWIFQGADDLVFHPGWDTEALKIEKRVIGTNDLHNPTVRRMKASTHTLIARSYIAERGGTEDDSGKVLCELYDHQYVDREFCEVAMRRGEWGFARSSHVEHLHPHWGLAKPDSTYRKAMRHGLHDRNLFHDRMGYPRAKTRQERKQERMRALKR